MESSFLQVKSGAAAIALVLVLSATLTANSFENVFETPRYLIILFFLLSMSAYSAVKERSLFIPEDRYIRYGFAALLFFLLLSFINSIAGPRVGAITLVFMWLLLVFNLAGFIQKQSLLQLLQQIFILQSPFILLVFLIFLNNETLDLSTMRPFFGNPNTCANYVALSMIYALWYLFFKPFKKEQLRILPPKLQQIFTIVILLLGGFLLVSFQSRGAILGFFIASLYLIFTHKRFSISKVYIALAAFTVFSLSFAALFYLKGFETLHIRYSYWRNTLCMIQENPLGVGPGAFRYVFENYSGKCYPELEAGETLILTHPHNMFLEVFAEGGIFVGFLFLFLLAYVALRLKELSKTFQAEVAWVFSYGILLWTIGFFEFPQHTPYVYFLMSLVAAVALSFFKGRVLQHSARMNLALVVFLTCIIARKAYAELVFKGPLTSTYTDNYQRACNLNDEDWEYCSRLAYRYLYKKDFFQAEQTILKLSKRYENYSRLIYLRGDYFSLKGDLPQACREFRSYDKIFSGSSVKASFIRENCFEKSPTK